MTESEYKNYLDVVTREIEHAAITFHTYQTIYKIVDDTPEILETLNQNPLFWLTQTFSLQAAFFLALRRIFDTSPDAYSIGRFINVTRKHPEFFTRAALEKRRCIRGNRPNRMNEFPTQSFDLNINELNDIHESLSDHRNKWTSVYVPICDSLFAHSLQNQEDVMADKLGRTNMADLEAMILHLRNVMYGFEDLYINGAHLQIGSRAIWDKKKIEESTRSLLQTLASGYKF